MRSVVLSVLMLVALSGLTAAYAEPAYYLNIQGIPGESTAKGHEKWIAVTAMQTQVPDRKSRPSSIQITKTVDASSPKLMEAAATGKHIPQVVIDAVNSGQTPQTYMTIKLQDVIITSYHETPGSAGSPPQEQIQLKFQKSEWIYHKPPAPSRSGAVETVPGSTRSG